MLGREPHGLFARLRFGDHGDVALRLEESSHPLAYQGVVVDQQNGCRLAHSLLSSLDVPARGQTQTTRVPSPSALSISTRPPSFSNRSLMLRRPKPS